MTGVCPSPCLGGTSLDRIPEPEEDAMTPEEARAHYNFLLTLCIRKAESFGPMAFTFIKDHTFPP